MEYRIFKVEEQKTKKQTWGETREIAVFPYDTKAMEEDILWRITKDTIEEEEAKLICFPGYDKVLTVLEGDVVLAHEGERVARMRAGEQDSFDGGMRTKSFGKITGYSLILKKENQGILEWIKAENQGKTLMPADFFRYKNQMWTFYCVKGYGIIHKDDETVMIREDELLVLNFSEEEPGEVKLMGEGDLIWSQIFHGKAEEKAEPEKTEEEAEPEETEEAANPKKAKETPSQKGTFRDFLTCIELANSNFRGGRRLFKSFRNVWFDEELQKSLHRIEKFYITFIVGLLGLTASTLIAWKLGGEFAVLIATIVWLIIHSLFIAPLIYFLVVPKPVSTHIKDIHSLTPHEQEIYQRQKSENPRLEKLLKKYATTGKNKYMD